MSEAGQPSGQPNLGARVLRGGQVLAVGTLAERLARLGRNMLLARVIAPDQFGMMAITLAVIALFEAMTEVGVAQAVIQNKRGDAPEFLNVAWWFGAARGLLVAAVAIPLAGPIARFYDQPDLSELLMVAPITVVFVGLTSPRVYALQRQFRFGATLWTIQGAGLLGTAVTIGLGFWLRNVWALLLGAVFESFARFVLSFIVCPIRPRFSLDRQSRIDLLRFMRGMAGLSLLALLMMQADTFVLGKVVTAEALGLYTMAIALAAFPLGIFSKVVQPLVVPILARYQDDASRLCDRVLGLSRLVWLFGLPMVTVMACFSEQLLVAVYGRPAFAQAAPAFAVYSLFTVTYMASMVSFSVYLATARPELQRRFTLVRGLVVVVTLYPMAVWLGGTGAALSLLGAMVVAMFVQILNLRKVIGLRPASYLGTLRAGLVASALILAPSLLVTWLMPTRAWLDVAIGAALGGATWTILLLRERRSLAVLREGGRSAPAPPDVDPLGTNGM